MAARPDPKTPRSRPLRFLTVLPLVAAGAVCAQTCTAPLPVPGSAAPTTSKFSLIETQCPALAEPAQTRRAAQLDLYSPAIPLGEPNAAAQPQRVTPVMLGGMPDAAAAAAPSAATPISAAAADRAGARILALTPTFAAAARANAIDPLLLHAIAHVESRHNPAAVSPAGAKGVMQVMPATGQRFGVADHRSLLDPQTNVMASAAYLRTLRLRFGDDLRLVVAAYNAGEGAVEKYGRTVPPYPETQNYVREVLAIYRRLTSTFTVDASGALIAKGVRS